MDRFIEFQNHKEKVPLRDLKSNMDRFIVAKFHGVSTDYILFKIQYG